MKPITLNVGLNEPYAFQALVTCRSFKVAAEAIHYGDLLSTGLPAGIEAFFARRRDFREINRDAAQLRACGKAL